jgi:hypothetical protein
LQKFKPKFIFSFSRNQKMQAKKLFDPNAKKPQKQPKKAKNRPVTWVLPT